MRLSEMRGQGLGLTVALRFLACDYCAVVDDNDERSRKGFNCPVCGQPSNGGLLYFPMAITTILDLMQSAFHRGGVASRAVGHEVEASEQRNDGSRLATIIYFATLTDLLLEHFLLEVAGARKIELPIAEHLLRESPYRRGRIGKLFPLFTHTTLKEAVSIVSDKEHMDFASTVSLAKDVNDKRNDLLHAGDKWSITAELPEECINRSPELVRLFVALHNHFVHPVYKDSPEMYFTYPT
jgi:hypothetical protein